MSYNFLNYDGSLVVSPLCQYDSNIGYEADFSVNGEVDGWDFYDGLHTYGCWNNFLFGTLYGDYAMIGRYEPIRPVEAETFYFVRIVMKLSLVGRPEGVDPPTKGRLMWKTISSPVWNSDKQQDFDIYFDAEWHTYFINLAAAQWWQGDISDIRIYPIVSGGRDGDELFIRVIEILSVDDYKCLNVSCDYYTRFEHNCPGIGERGYCKSFPLDAYTFQGTQFEFAGEKRFDIVAGVNDTLYVNINGYGFENIVLDEYANAPGDRIANALAREISKLDVGGYAECTVEYTDHGEFLIYSGVYADDSVVSIGDSPLARDLKFFDASGKDISTKHTGRTPASGFLPYSSFKIKTHQIYSLLDNNDDTDFYFNPFIYNVEGGRRDWLETGLGKPLRDVRTGETEDSGVTNRYYEQILNKDKTIIDFTHPFNASGRINKIYAAVTLDNFIDGDWTDRGLYDAERIKNQLSGAKIMFFRPMKNGDIRVLPIEISIPDRDHASGKLYSAMQEVIELECDVFVNKGDLIGVYNANVYRGRSVTGEEVDALYYQTDGKAKDIIRVRQPLGQGSAGLLMYARSNQIQNRLILSLNLGKRVNVDKITVVGDTEEKELEFNVARCLDINWEVDLFDGHHSTGWIRSYRPLKKAYHSHPNLYYGKENLTDGIKTVPDGLTADSFTVESPDRGYMSLNSCLGKKDGGRGVIPTGAKYFYVNGDNEWLANYLHAGRLSPFMVGDFSNDPIAFTLRFPFEKDKLLKGSKIYFKDQYNFRSFALSFFRGKYYARGNADDPRFELIPYRIDGTKTPWSKITLDGLEFTPENNSSWQAIDLYLAENPTIGHLISVQKGVSYTDYDKYMAYYDELGGLDYLANFTILNNEQFTQATSVDWTILEHEWPPQYAKGFRIHCNNHKSTKICEMEVYCSVENIKSAMGGSIEIYYSFYGDYWWSSKNKEIDTGVECFIGDTPQYVDITIKPIVETRISDILVDVSFEDVFMGEKGCQTVFVPTEAKRGVLSAPQKIDFKNVYGRPYDLFVDIASPELVDEGTVFYSLLNDAESIDNPIIGADAFYRKHEDYLMLNYQGNVAINCPVFALKNLVDGVDAWYSHDNEYSWKYWGKIDDGNKLNFSNLPNATITTVNLPVLVRSKWWKFGFFDPRVVMTIREIQVYKDDEEISGINFFHHKDANVYSTPNTDTAPHLKNDIVNGSYYILKGDNYIGFELPTEQVFNKIVIYHDALLDYENSHDKAGIDSSTALCIHGVGDTFQTDTIVDESYYEHDIVVVGSGIYCDESSETAYYEFTEDFSDCKTTIDEFMDLTNWTDLVGASLVDEKLHITNSGIIGEASSIDYYYGDFTMIVDLEVDNAYDGQGWGCYLEAFTDDNFHVRVGKTFIFDATTQQFRSEHFNEQGWSQLVHLPNISANSDLQLKLNRDGATTYCAARIGTADWLSLGSTTALSSKPVRVKLISNLTPLAPPGEITTGVFDNFSVDRSASDWGTNITYNSTFTCSSGIGPNGFGYLYNIGCRNDSDASGFKDCRVFETQSYPFDEEFAFTFDFTFQTYEFLDRYGSSTNGCGVSVGILGKHVRDSYGTYPWWDFFTGVQVVLRRDHIGIGLRNEWTAGAETYVALDTSATAYYCRFTANGEGHYHCYVWTDDWEGSNEVANFGLDSALRWTAFKVGVGSGYTDGEVYTERATGWVSDFNFTCDMLHKNSTIHNSSIKFSGFEGEKLIVSQESSPLCNIVKEGFYFDTKRVTFDFFISFKSLPIEEGESITIAKCWNENQPLQNGLSVSEASSWALLLTRKNSNYYWQFFANVNGICRHLIDWTFYPDLYRWYHFYFCRGPENYNPYYFVIVRDGHELLYTGGAYFDDSIFYSNNDIIIGENLDGWISEFRISSDYTKGGGRVYSLSSYPENIAKSVPTKQYERYYTLSFYESTNNIYYGKNFDVDVLFDNTYSYHEPLSYWSEKYYTYFAIDFGQRHDIDFVRSFPIDDAYIFTRSENILYSAKDTADPVTAFSLTAEEQELSSTFEGEQYSYPNNWNKFDTVKANSFIIDGTFTQIAAPASGQEISQAQMKAIFKGDFDLHIDYNLGNGFPENDTWEIKLQVVDTNNANNAVAFSRCYQNGGNQYKLWVKDNSSSWSLKFATYQRDQTATMRLERSGSIFKCYLKRIDQPFESFVLQSSYQMKNTFNSETQFSLYTISDSPAYPRIQVWWDNLVITKAAPIISTASDARWARVKMLNGDGDLKTIVSVGMYPKITKSRNAAGQPNHYWKALGTSITSYADAVNIALGATVSGSSYIGSMLPERVVDGIIPDGAFDMCWGSDEEDNPWLEIHLLQVEPIFRFKLYHGYLEEDKNNLINDYKIQTSLDGETFTTVFQITGNDKFIRIHDLVTPVYAKVVRLYVDKYTAVSRFVWKNVEEGYQFWKGAVLKEFEIYKYYGFTVIDSESSPVIAIDLRQAYFIKGHELVGIDSENDEIDWDNSDSNFAWSNSHFTDPTKVTFTEWGTAPKYEKWAVIKRNTATHYPKVPTDTQRYTDTPDFLKHAIIRACVDEYNNNPNPVQHPWFWRSNISELSYDYDNVTDTGFVPRSLRIDYPASTTAEHISFIEGDHFGVDAVASWRDGFGLFIYIDDIDNLDLEYGYFYLGGFDYTRAENPVIHRWNMTTLSGVLHSGWNNLNLTFLYADEVTYTELVDTSGRDPRRLYTIKWGKIGFVFRGKGSPLRINLEGFFIERNHFEHGCFPGQKGLYLHANDIFKVPIGEFDFQSSALEFWMRPDWTWDGQDRYRDFKFRTLFHFGNVANDILGAAISSRGLEIYYGNLLLDFNVFIVSGFGFNAIDKLTHIAFVFSNNGTGIGNDGSTIRVYLGNQLMAVHYGKWDISDDKHFNFMLGGQGLLNLKTQGFDPTSSAVDAVISRLKIHNYAKTDYSDSMIDYGGDVTGKILKPHNFIEISDDNVTYHKVGSKDLPFFFDDVPPGESIPIWVKVHLPRNLTGVEKRTAEVLGSWDIGV